jgi:hypothetical protein
VAPFAGSAAWNPARLLTVAAHIRLKMGAERQKSSETASSYRSHYCTAIKTTVKLAEFRGARSGFLQ